MTDAGGGAAAPLLPTPSHAARTRSPTQWLQRRRGRAVVPALSASCFSVWIVSHILRAACSSPTPLRGGSAFMGPRPRVFQRLKSSPRSFARRFASVPTFIAAAQKSDLDVASANIDARIVGTWRYPYGAYRITVEDGRYFFREHLHGELFPQGEWLVAELGAAGTIRLRLDETGTKIESNFKTAGAKAWGESITAVVEWGTIAERTKRLRADLESLEFEGVSTDGNVVVKVNGHQRPKQLRIALDADSSVADLERRLMEAHGSAREQSMDNSTELLRELYASHFEAQPLPITNS